jgi:nucleotide-binding universal stress UspA family protein
MHKILVPVDGSESALRAVHHATSLAKEIRGASIHLINVHEEPVLYGEIAVYVPREKMETLLREHSEAILSGATAIVQASGVEHTSEALIGKIAPTIAKHAKKLGCDGIVMGTHGTTGITSVLMGSVSSRVVHLSDVPVTLVK